MEPTPSIEPIRKASDAKLRDKLIELIERCAVQTPCGYFADLILSLVREHQSDEDQNFRFKPQVIQELSPLLAEPDLRNDVLHAAIEALDWPQSAYGREKFISELNKRLSSKSREEGAE
ncbi:hypothetical protein [Prosthecobacter sp.]|uniref:hypothetical protein n=1 Tax=Prosthecobacter sp. TaxID=1965333 RepID=UPI003783C6C6